MIAQNDYSYDDETLDVLEQVLRDVWEVLKAHQPYPGWQSDTELKRKLAHSLMALADAGVRDPQQLRSSVLASFPLQQSN
jgi:hypothetical protein